MGVRTVAVRTMCSASPRQAPTREAWILNRSRVTRWLKTFHQRCQRCSVASWSMWHRWHSAARFAAALLVKMRAGEHYMGRAHPGERDTLAHPDPPATTAPPAPRVHAPPSSIAQVRHMGPVRLRAPLAARSGPLEADRVGQLRPVDRVQPTVLRVDRHPDSRNHTRMRAKRKRHAVHLWPTEHPPLLPNGQSHYQGARDRAGCDRRAAGTASLSSGIDVRLAKT